MLGLYDEVRAEEGKSFPVRQQRLESIFGLDRIDWEGRLLINSLKSRQNSRARTISKVAVNNGVIVVATNVSTVIRWRLNSNPRDTDEIELSGKADDLIEQLFLDPSGNHVIISMRNSDAYYLNSKAVKAKRLSKIQGVIECISFDGSQISEGSTKSFLVATSLGYIYEISLESTGKEKIFQILYQLESPAPITSIYFEWLSGGDGSSSVASADTRSLLVLFATTTPTRLYHHIGGPTFAQVFGEGKDRVSIPYTELPGELKRAELQTFNSSMAGKGRHFALLTAPGLYYGPLSSFQTSADSLVEANVLPYPASAVGNDALSSPLAFATTEFHFLILKSRCIQAVSLLNGDLMQEEAFVKGDGTAVGIASDYLKVLNLVYTNTTIYQVLLANEGRHVWRLFLNKAVASGDDLFFESAAQHSKSQDQRKIVNRTRAEFYAENGEMERAASCFARSGQQFEEITLRLLSDLKASFTASIDGDGFSLGNELLSSYWCRNVDAATPLRTYLLEMLKNSLSTQMKSQRAMLCVWLCEIFLHQISLAQAIEDESSSSNILAESIVSEFQKFVREHRLILDHSTVLTLIIERNQRNLLLFFAKIMGDYHRVISILLSNGKYFEALSVLMDAPTEKIEQFIYRITPLLIVHEPEITISMLLRKSQLQFSGLLPAVLHYASYYDQLTDVKKDENYAVQFLESLLSRAGLDVEANLSNSASFDVESHPGIDLETWITSNIESALIHAYVWFLAKYEQDVNEAKLSSFLSRLQMLRELGALDEVVTVDAEYILRQCRNYKRKSSSIRALILLNCRKQAVIESLHIDLALSRQIAAAEKDVAKKKLLWIDIARFVILNDPDIKNAVSVITESSGTLQIEDLLPLLPDFTEIELFKTEICTSLELCTERIDMVKEDMSKLADSVLGTMNELDTIKNRCQSLSSSHQKCEVCWEPLLSRQFYLFPCSHAFHTECLVEDVINSQPPAKVAALQTIREALQNITTKSRELDARSRVQFDALREEMDDFVASDCLLCGYSMIQSLMQPLINEGAADEAKSWRIGE